MNRYELLRRNIRKILIESSLIDGESMEKLNILIKSENEVYGDSAKPGAYQRPQAFELLLAMGIKPEEFGKHIGDIQTFRALGRLCLLPIFPEAHRIYQDLDHASERRERLSVDFATIDGKSHAFYVDINWENKTMHIRCFIGEYNSHWLAKRRPNGTLIQSESQGTWPILNKDHPLYPCPIGEVPLDLSVIIKCAKEYKKLMMQNLPKIKDPNRTRNMPYV